MNSVMTRTFVTALLLFISSSISRISAEESREAPSDTVCVMEQSKHGNWVKQLIGNGFHINDPSINYPKFARFLVNVYNWGDRTFNSYDTTYVVGTGKNWKLRGNSQNWAQSYVMEFANNKRNRMFMMSHIYSDLGGYLSFMAVSIGQTYSTNQIFNHTKEPRQHFSFNFVCSRFSANYSHYSTTGGVSIHRFGDYNEGHHISVPFNNIRHKTSQGNIYYFFNNKRYSQAAAYAYSKYQLKSAGSWIAGINLCGQDINMNFSSLPEDMLVHLPLESNPVYHFHSTDYDLLGGYGYNWVIRPKVWLLNFTVMPSIGLKHSYEDATDGRRNMFSTNINAQFSVVYNHRSLFLSLYGIFDGHVIYNPSYTFFNSSESLNLNVGMRF